MDMRRASCRSVWRSYQEGWSERLGGCMDEGLQQGVSWWWRLSTNMKGAGLAKNRCLRGLGGSLGVDIMFPILCSLYLLLLIL